MPICSCMWWMPRTPNHPEQIEQVQRVLHEIGADHIPQILVFNKLDALPPERRPLQLQARVESDGQTVVRQFVSARTGEGLADLRQLLAQRAVGTQNLGTIPFQEPNQTNA